MVVHHSLHSSLTPPQVASPLSHHCHTPPKGLLGEQSRGLPGLCSSYQDQQLVAAVGLSRLFQGLSNPKCMFGRTQLWMGPQHKP